jgi:GAF domain-containing protein
MSPSILFLLNLAVSFISGIVALALLVLVLGVGLRQRLNQAFALFISFAAITSISSAVVGLTLWLEIGHSLFWAELFAAGFYFVGPSLAAFALVYIGSNAQRHKLVILIGFLVGLALIPALFDGQIISQVRSAGNDLYDLDVTQLGYTAAIGSLLFQVLALVTFWRFRGQLGSSAPAISTAILVAGALYDFLLRVPFPPLSFTFGTGILILGHDVMRRQIFNPLRTLTEELEAQVAQRTQELQQVQEELQSHNEQHHHIAQISHELAQISDPAKILGSLAELIHKQLGYHHVYVYQPDETNRYLILQAAAGTTARTVMSSGQRLSIGGRSLPGQVAAPGRRQARIAEARGDDAAYFGDTALPGARGEMTLPLLVGDRLLGVLDFQSIHFEAFSPEDLVMMTALADQAAVTLDNARLLQRTEAALAELEKSQRQYLHQAWRSITGEPESAPAYVYTAGSGVAATSLKAAWSPTISQAVAEHKALSSVAKEDEGALASPTVGGEDAAPSTKPGKGEHPEVLTLPITLRGQIIGALEVRQKAGRTWQREDMNILTEIAERLGLALETARLSQENQRRATRERLIREITSDMRETMNTETILERTIQRLGQEIGAEEVAVRNVPAGQPHPHRPLAGQVATQAAVDQLAQTS